LIVIGGILFAVPAVNGNLRDDIRHLCAGGTLGLFVGILCALEMKMPRRPGAKAIIGSAAGLLLGAAFAILLKQGVLGIAGSALVGVGLGATGKWWAVHVNLP